MNGTHRRSWAGIAGLLVDALSAVAGATIGRLLRCVDDAQDIPDDPCASGTCTHRWETSTLDAGENVHVTPLRDQIHHTETDDCVCGPRTEAVFRNDGSNGWLHIHHALDRREANE